MNGYFRALAILCMGALSALAAAARAQSQEVPRVIFPEQRHIEVRDSSQLQRARIPDLPPPTTVANPQLNIPPQNLSLDEAIRVALANTRVIRTLAGTTAVSSGRTIYDTAISNTLIDQQRGRFDPQFQIQNNFSRRELPGGVFAPAPPFARITGAGVNDYDMTMGLTKDNVTGGTAALGVNANSARSNVDPLPLNPEVPSSVDLGYTQPLLQGFGVRVNMAPIVIARIETERSFFDTKGSVQDMVRGVIEGYWALVQARTAVWANQQQVDQGLEGFRRAEALLRAGLGSATDVALARSSLANFRATLISAQANVLAREDALRNLLGLPPSEPTHITPVTPVTDQRLVVRWPELLDLAEQRRPDLVQLKLILEADQQRLLVAKNQALPRVDASALYRWNGLEGRTPDRTIISSRPGEFTDWQLGVNFSVPLGLRQSRAAMRQQELILVADRANLEQGLHSTTHALAASLRNLDSYYEQYLAFKETREAARVNLDVQFANYRAGRPVIYLNVLQAITDWGNAVNAEAQALTQYNTQLATLEQETGTILETHGIRFAEERYCSIGPLGRAFADRPYPMAEPPGPNANRYPASNEPAENAFDLRDPIPIRSGAANPAARPPDARIQFDIPPRSPEPIPTPAP
ncbi:MAG: TolC family protein [Pirellulales bacterium]